MLQLITYLRLPGVLEVDARLSESPGEAQIELAGTVPGLVVLVVVFGISIPRRAIISVLEGHDSRGRQDEPVLEEALAQAKGVDIVNAVPILKNLLNDKRLSITQIAEMMKFRTLSYFSRYCKKQLGMSPQEYRKSLQPK